MTLEKEEEDWQVGFSVSHCRESASKECKEGSHEEQSLSIGLWFSQVLGPTKAELPAWHSKMAPGTTQGQKGLRAITNNTNFSL